MDEPMQKERIDASDLRAGDLIIHGDINDYFTKQAGCSGQWNVTVSKRDGVLGYETQWANEWRPESHKGGRWRRGIKLYVRSPRPEPEKNEFGLITP